MRIAVIVHTFPPSSEAGSEIYARELAIAMRHRHGDEILVVTREADRRRRERAVRTEHVDGLTIVRINNTFADLRDFDDGYVNERLGAVAASVIDEFAPDLAHIHHLTCLSTALVDALTARGVPIVCTLHDYWLMCHRGQRLDRSLHVCDGPGASGCGACLGPEAAAGALAYRLKAAARRAVGMRVGFPRVAQKVIERRARRGPSADGPTSHPEPELRRIRHMRRVCSQVTRFIAPSRAMRDAFVAFGVSPERITVSPYGFNHAPFAGNTPVTAERLRLGFIGSVMSSKAPHLLLDAGSRLAPGSASIDLFGDCRDYHGDDSYRAMFHALLARSGGRYHGAIPHRQIPRALASLDVLVVPSIWPENSPLVIGEAFLAGVPVLASRIGGIPELVDHGRNGLLFEPGDAADLARAIARLANEPALLHGLRLGAAATAVRAIEDDADETRQLYQRVISADAAPRPRLAAIVLNYRAADDTLLAVKSLQASRRVIDEIIVVDNDAAQPAADALASIDGRLDYLRTSRNLGYSGGMNVGIRLALDRGAERVILVNSDVIVPPDCVDRLERGLAATPASGIAGPLIMARSSPDVVASAGMSYRPRSGRMRHRRYGMRMSDAYLPPSEVVDAVSGCLMLVRREVFDAIGLLDENYFFSFEDLDFCLRARRAGFVTLLAASALAYHEGGRSIGAQSVRRLYFAARGHLLAARNAGPPAGALGVACRTGSIIALNLAHAVRFRGAVLPVRLAAVMRGCRDYFARRFGPDRDASL